MTDGAELADDRVAVAVCTRRRPIMLSRLLESLSRLEIPRGVEPVFLVVENDDSPRVRPVVEGLADRFAPAPVVHVLESRRGISQARNRAIVEAVSRGCRWLAFVDDDEVVEPQWLEKLLEAARSRNLQMVGGPWKISVPDESLSVIEKAILDDYVRKSEERIRANNAKFREGREQECFQGTGNWLADLTFLQKNCIRFPEDFNLTGGEDIVVYHSFKEKGGRYGWAPEAVVWEQMSRERLTLADRFRRAANGTVTIYRIRRMIGHRDSAARWLVKAVGKFVGGTAALLTVPFRGAAGLAEAVRRFGVAFGALKALTGFGSRHYERTQGR